MSAYARVRAAVARRLSWLAVLAAIGASLPLWQDFVPTTVGRWLADLAVHWQWPYLIVGLACAGGWLALAGSGGRARPAAVLAVVLGLAALNLSWTSLPALPQAAAGDAARDLKFASFNVNLDNREVQAILDWVAAESPDVLALLEVTPEMQPLLAALAARYPHSEQRPRPDPFGMAVFSRHAWQGAQFVSDAGAPQRFTAQVQAPGGAFALHVLHPMPPISAADRVARDALLADLTHVPPGTATAPGAVLMGDLNTTPWASGLRGMAAAGWARATGLSPTYALGLSLPLDHVLATGAHWQRGAHGVGPWLGSDHRPVWAVLRPR